jgi:hypothetical protein
MGEVIRFIPKAERERIRLMQETRAMYDSAFPPSDSVNEQRNYAPTVHSVNGPKSQESGEVLS